MPIAFRLNMADIAFATLLQELPLWFLLGQRQRLLTRRPTLQLSTTSKATLRTPSDPQTWLPSRSRRNVFARFDHMGGQEPLWKILRIQGHDEIGPASFSATAEGIVSRIGRG